MISQIEFEEKCQEYDKIESRANYFERASKLLNKNFKTEARILLLATWNFAGFRYGINEFNTEEFDYLFYSLNPTLLKLKEEKIEKADFKKLEEDISKIYTPLSKIKGIQYTGASKLMLLENPSLFSPWDQYIRKEYGFGTSANDYSSFLGEMQKRFSHLTAPKNKTLAKAIDEFNYITITIPALKKQ
jgi:hypothetical protein